MRTVIITTVRDLRQWVEDHMGPDGNGNLTIYVSEWVRKQDHPPWGSDWSGYLDALDLWDIAAGIDD